MKHHEKMNANVVVDVCDITSTEGSPVRPKGILETSHNTDSVGKEKASACGCNANNSHASVRTLNANNALSNSNGNYAGAFAVNEEQIIDNNRKHFSTQATSLNISEDLATKRAQGCLDYESIPFWEDNAESDTIAFKESILDELQKANSKRKLKNLKRFFINYEIVKLGVERCLSHAAESKEVNQCKKIKEKIINRIIEEMNNETYHCTTPIERTLKNKKSKERHAKIYSVYDRCVQNVVLIVIERKLRNCVYRYCYSGIPMRSIFSNDKRYCLNNHIRKFVSRHPNATVGMSDIKHFYESLSPTVVFGSVMRVVKCPFTLRLLYDILFSADSLPIGGTLSQILAMFTLSEFDEHIRKKFKPQFYAAFGDNRIIIDDNPTKVKNMLHYEMSYIEGRFNLSVKNDWQIKPVKYGFRFCKYDYKGSYSHIRSELKRRAIRAAKRGSRYFAGYKGILMKTDSKKLLFLINNNLKTLIMRNNKGMNVRPFLGELVKINNLTGKQIVITDWKKVDNNKESKYYIKFQFILLHKDGRKTLHVCHSGCCDIKQYFNLIENGQAKLGEKLTLCQDGNSFYFEGYHTSNEEALTLLCQQFNID